MLLSRHVPQDIESDKLDGCFQMRYILFNVFTTCYSGAILFREPLIMHRGNHAEGDDRGGHLYKVQS